MKRFLLENVFLVVVGLALVLIWDVTLEEIGVLRFFAGWAICVLIISNHEEICDKIL